MRMAEVIAKGGRVHGLLPPRWIEQALLRYCELDTFAIVMIMEAWLEWGRGQR